jgi:hypothetical protein
MAGTNYSGVFIPYFIIDFTWYSGSFPGFFILEATVWDHFLVQKPDGHTHFFLDLEIQVSLFCDLVDMQLLYLQHASWFDL